MKKIVLTKGYASTVDDEDFEKVSKFKWLYRGGSKGYASRRTSAANGKKWIHLHRFVLGITDPNVEVDHINGNSLDNRKENLRITSRVQNMRNRTHIVLAKSGYRGVYFKKNVYKPWYSRIRLDNGKDKHLGYHYTAEEAAKAFDKAAKEIYGEFCGKLNFE
ncbi:MAG: Fis family transcriptional regulator [Leptolyngbyaceae cyanobacterium RM2_2_4]|nr:Fis family transcriptional regulator [Leptolyngbyaceae cyanobacterium RM2_2_4]